MVRKDFRTERARPMVRTLLGASPQNRTSCRGCRGRISIDDGPRFANWTKRELRTAPIMARRTVVPTCVRAGWSVDVQLAGPGVGHVGVLLLGFDLPGDIVVE